LAKLVAEPATLDPRVAVEEQQAAKIADLPPAAEPDNSGEGVKRLEALQSVLAEVPEPPADPEEVAIEEAAEPTIEERQEFIRCVLGNKPYQKAFELFGGAIRLTMADISPKEIDTLYSQLAKDHKAGVVETMDDWSTELDRYRMFWTIKELMWGDECSKPHAMAMETTLLRNQLDTFMMRFKSTVPYRAMLRVSRIFQRHLDKLMAGALDPDFWEGGGSDLPSEPTSEEPSTTESSPG
jgi:hypothetical protein